MELRISPKKERVFLTRGSITRASYRAFYLSFHHWIVGVIDSKKVSYTGVLYSFIIFSCIILQFELKKCSYQRRYIDIE